ncbi:uncharacterized protein SPPG_00512 [Spizellomyces punctatus DAOM BR117]|uniref:Uncharacterized protein n=1 Tax=Spizellomyces punctatus (strain DAOM BR117) TaxID=645134 RepID=A0A0L0HVA5_SPIPD|nr:uncharacterized protein SPPG_00512 [Spizellomyces punctatus DAOM BR117]KND04809.1 hypothetical protein SPPG_00512 [Spizellomyces punctatus DAOM BR117]|eukprot:XP_016612848.1 hypothetical protein SPPG_00512 [Spizellomyces punctatus DAOM BR117]
MGFLPGHSLGRPSAFGTNTTTNTSLPSRQPSTASSRENARYQLSFATPRLPPAPPPPSTPLRRHGSDLSIAYSLGSHYNTPLKEAMASWEEDLALAETQTNSGTLKSAMAPSLAGSTLVEERVRVTSISAGTSATRYPKTLRDENRVAGLANRAPSRSARDIAENVRHSRLSVPEPGQLPLFPSWSGSGSSGTVLNEATSAALGITKRGPSMQKSPDSDIEIGIPSINRPSESVTAVTTQLDEPIHNESTAELLQEMSEAKSRRRKRWWFCPLMTIGILCGGVIVTGIVLIILDRLGVVPWQVVKSNIVSAAQAVGSWFQRNFSPKLSTAGVVIVAVTSATVAIACVTYSIVLLRRRRRRHRKVSGPPAMGSARRKKSIHHFNEFLGHTPSNHLPMARSPSSASLGIVHYNCDFLLPSTLPADAIPDTATLAASAAEPTQTDHGNNTGEQSVDRGHGSRGGSAHERYKGGGGTVVQVLPPEAVVRRVPTLTYSAAGVEASLVAARIAEGRRKAS